MPDDVRWVLGNRDERPPTYYGRARLEESFHNAFKALKALLGGELRRAPEAKRKRLTIARTQPDGMPDLPDGRGENVITRLARLTGLRDKRSAHAAKTGGDRRLTFYDLLEMQRVASWMIGEAIEAGAGDAPTAPAA